MIRLKNFCKDFAPLFMPSKNFSKYKLLGKIENFFPFMCLHRNSSKVLEIGEFLLTHADENLISPLKLLTMQKLLMMGHGINLAKLLTLNY